MGTSRMIDESVTLEFYALDLPPEPPVGSVILDDDGIAYQSGEGQNAETGAKCNIYYKALPPRNDSVYGYRTHSWASLLIEKQPLRLIYRAETKEDDNA